ncbi:hypothetical protein [Chitinophaga sp. 22620]|uniref:hypothetical protein n=1 Tax=Chitinophaga sp. 22620 TaxID=3453952 RepID=UPI003F838F02
MEPYFPERIVIYTKDVEVILGKSERSARNFLRMIKRALKKSDRQFVTLAEFCYFTGISVDEVKECIKR